MPQCGHLTALGTACRKTVRQEGCRCFLHTDAQDSTSECPICLHDSSGPCKTLPCGHEFHRRCILQWKRGGHHTCPVCRQPFMEPSPHFKITLIVENVRRQQTREFQLDHIPQFIQDMNIITDDADRTEIFIDVNSDEAMRAVLDDLQIRSPHDLL